MSLITDALKQAQKTTDQQPGQTPPPVTTQAHFVDVPQECTERPRNRLLVVLIAVLVVVAGGVVVRSRLFKRSPHNQMPIPSATEAARGRASEKSATNAAAKSPVPASKPAEATPITRATENVKTEQVAPAPTPLPEPPKLTLQGVMIEGQDREAVINGVSVHVGDNLEGARVTAIDTRSVRLQFGDREIVLRLP
jgi:hypothetical protein